MKFVLIFLVFYITFSDGAICQKGYSAVGNDCWKLNKTPATHAVAERKCIANGGHLITVKSADENKAVAKFLSSSAINSVWLGIYCFGNMKKECYWDDQSGSVASYDSFGADPNIQNGKCVSYNAIGFDKEKWSNKNCSEQLPFICELPPTESDPCPHNFDNNCYRIIKDVNQTTAFTECDQLGGIPASIHSPDENLFITTAFAPHADTLRLGGISPSSGFIRWSDNSNDTYNNVEVFDPNQSCLYISLQNNNEHSEGGWYTGNCMSSEDFLCKRWIGDGPTPSLPIYTPAPFLTIIPDCFTGIHMAPGVIASPNFPSPYPGNSTCRYSLATYGPNRIRLTFTYLAIMSNMDYVYIYDGDNYTAPIITFITGTLGKTQKTVVSTGNTMFVDFRVNSNNPKGFYSGFIANFCSVFG